MNTYIAHVGGDVRARRQEAIFFLAAFAVPILYALHTSHIWEDFFITYKFSKNLVDGHGLVYHPGERVYGFTSVINTLLPSFFYWLTQSFHPYLGALWLYRIASAAAFATAGLLTFNYLREKDENPDCALFFAVLFVVETKAIAFTSNGQEAGFMLVFLMPALIYAFEDIERHWKLVGACWAGLLYTRPDAVVYITAISASLLVFSERRKKTFVSLLAAVSLTAVIYLPWFVFAWSYYGNPVPHTIISNSTYLLGEDIELLSVLESIVHVLVSIYAPIYHSFGGWPGWVYWFSLTSSVIAAGYWLLPSEDRFGRFTSLFFSLMVAYFVFLANRGGVFPWYLPPTAIAGFVVLSRGVVAFLAWAKVKIGLAVSLMGTIAVGFIAIFLMSAHQLRIQQHHIEFGNRMKVGLWLKEHVKEGERVYLEPLGYIGFFSNAKVLDYPGLVSPEVVAVNKAVGRAAFGNVIGRLEPEWLVLRPFELQKLSEHSGLGHAYEPKVVFDARRRLNGYRYIAGRGYLDFDSVFVVLRRQ